MSSGEVQFKDGNTQVIAKKISGYEDLSEKESCFKSIDRYIKAHADQVDWTAVVNIFTFDRSTAQMAIVANDSLDMWKDYIRSLTRNAVCGITNNHGELVRLMSIPSEPTAHLGHIREKHRLMLPVIQKSIQEKWKDENGVARVMTDNEKSLIKIVQDAYIHDEFTSMFYPGTDYNGSKPINECSTSELGGFFSSYANSGMSPSFLSLQVSNGHFGTRWSQKATQKSVEKRRLEDVSTPFEKKKKVEHLDYNLQKKDGGKKWIDKKKESIIMF